MRKPLEVLFLLVLIGQTQRGSLALDLCTIPVSIIVNRATCSPLQILWVLRQGKCVKAAMCIKGYTQQQCQEHCIRRRKNPTTTQKPTTVECTTKIKLTTEAGITNSPTTERTMEIETKRTRRTRRPRTTQHVDCLFLD